MRQLESKKVPFEVISYNTSDGKIDGISVAQKIGYEVSSVYKTLVLTGTKGYYVALVPVDCEIDLKKAAHSIGEKSIQMLAVKDLVKTTGYERGGCSPIGMKKHFLTFIDSSINAIEYVVVSAGAIGLQMKLQSQTLVRETHATIVDLV